MHPPDHEHGQSQDHEINQDVGNAVPTIELYEVDACPAAWVNGSGPEEGAWRACEDGYQ